MYNVPYVAWGYERANDPWHKLCQHATVRVLHITPRGFLNGKHVTEMFLSVQNTSERGIAEYQSHITLYKPALAPKPKHATWFTIRTGTAQFWQSLTGSFWQSKAKKWLCHSPDKDLLQWKVTFNYILLWRSMKRWQIRHFSPCLPSLVGLKDLQSAIIAYLQYS